ncbi:MAG: glycosyltransferase family 1 protein, partial [Thermoanaerobaculia bacterium]
MRLGIDACCWSNQRGFGRFTRELVTHLVACCSEENRHQVVLVVDRATADSGQFPAGARLEIVATRRQPTRAAAAASSRSPADLWRMRRGVARCRPDIFFFPAVYTFYPIARRIPTVVTFHDAIAESHPRLIFSGWRSRWLWALKTRLALRQAERVLTVSQDARRQIMGAFGVPASRIAVTHEGPGEGLRPIDDTATIRRVLKRHGLPAEIPWILYVGGISPHKNLAGLLRALRRISDQTGTPPRLAIVGDYRSDAFLGCYQELSALVDDLGLRHCVTFTGFVPDRELVALYNAATLLVLPSFSEGFGLPVVEAMACGLPVAVSRAGSLPELVGDAGLFFDPADVDDIAATISRLLDGAPLRQRLRQRGLERARGYSWESSARRVLKI